MMLPAMFCRNIKASFAPPQYELAVTRSDHRTRTLATIPTTVTFGLCPVTVTQAGHGPGLSTYVEP